MTIYCPLCDTTISIITFLRKLTLFPPQRGVQLAEVQHPGGRQDNELVGLRLPANGHG